MAFISGPPCGRCIPLAFLIGDAALTSLASSAVIVGFAYAEESGAGLYDLNAYQMALLLIADWAVASCILISANSETLGKRRE
jgi:hypothetical protein